MALEAVEEDAGSTTGTSTGAGVGVAAAVVVVVEGVEADVASTIKTSEITGIAGREVR